MASVWYEVEHSVKGRWQLDTVFDELDIAISEAERLLESGRAIAVRVVRVEDSDRPPHTVFRKSRLDDTNREYLSQRASLQDQAIAARKKRQEQIASHINLPAGRSRSAPTRLLGRLATLALLSAAVVGTAWWLQGSHQSREADHPAGIGSSGESGPVIHWGGR